MKFPVFLVTPRHGYLIITIDDQFRKEEAAGEYSHYSSIVGNNVYLEEDCDAPRYAELRRIDLSAIPIVYGDFNRCSYPPVNQRR